ncbi:hypothetical protein ZWY2020_034323 [Hordeum vulgare]|nr:hypothetical protein ZWY2020_034323 [Hordeum vulgare]
MRSSPALLLVIALAAAAHLAPLAQCDGPNPNPEIGNTGGLSLCLVAKVREDVDKSLLHKGQGPLRTDDELASMEEGSRMYMDLSPLAPSVVNNHGHELNLTVLSTEPEQPMGDEGMFI